MNFRFTAILFGVVVLALVSLIVYFAVGDKPSADGLVHSFTSAAYKSSDVDTVEIIRTQPNEQKLVFVRADKDKPWTLKEPVAARVESSQIDAIVSALFNAKPTAYAQLSKNLTVHGLDKPSLKVTLKGKNNVSSTVNFGDTTIGGNDAVTFVTTSQFPDTPIAVKAVELRAFFKADAPGVSRDGPASKTAKWLTDFRQKRLIATDIANLTTDIQKLSFSRGKETLVLAGNKTDGWWFEVPTGFGAADVAGDTAARPDTITGIRPLLNILSTLQANTNDDFIEGVVPADFGKYGLADADPSVIRCEITPRDGQPEVLFIGKPVDENGKPTIPAKVYCRIAGDTAVIKVPSERIPALAKIIADPGDLRNRDLISETSKETIDAIDVSVGAGIMKLRRLAGGSDPRWVIYGGAEPRHASNLEVRNLLNALTRPRAARDVIPGITEEPFTKPLGEIKVWTSSIGKVDLPPDGKFPSEPVLTGTPTTFTVGRKDGDAVQYLRRATKETTIFRVPVDLPLVLLRDRLAYIDPKLGSFNTGIAQRITYTQSGLTTDLVKSTDVDPYYSRGKWVYALPEANKGKTVNTSTVEDMLLRLSTHSPRLIAETVSPEQLAAWGLKPEAPRLRVVVGLKSDQEKERIYDFGNESDDKQSIYFKMSGKPFVFLLNKEDFSIFTNADLRDPILFRVDAEKVVQVDFLGWKGTGAAPINIKVRREKEGWKVLEPAGFQLDETKLNGLLRILEAPRAQEFVTNLPPASEHGCSPADGGLQIVLSLADGKPGQLLILGKEDSTRQIIYGLGSSLPPGTIVKFPASLYRPFTQTPPSTGK